MESNGRYSSRSGLLQEAEKIVTQERNKTYGEPDDHFQQIASLANALGFRIETKEGTVRPLSGSDHTLYMLCVKLSRLSVGDLQHRDSWLDIAGYAGCGYETASLEQSRKQANAPRPVAPSAGYSMPGKPALDAIPDEVMAAAMRACAGDPMDLEGMGYFLGDSADGANACGALCSEGIHRFRPGCAFRIKRRRADV